MSSFTWAGDAPFCGPNTAGARRRSGCARRTPRPARCPAGAAAGRAPRSAPEPSVGGRRAADADEHPTGPRLDAERDELTGAGGGGVDRVVAVGATDQVEARGRGHLDHRRPASTAATPPRPARPRARHDGRAVGAAEHVERSPHHRRPWAARRCRGPAPRAGRRSPGRRRAAVAVPLNLSGAMTTCTATVKQRRSGPAGGQWPDRCRTGAMAQRPVVIVSNRGPLSFSLGADGDLVAKRGAGGLVSGLAPLVTDTDAVWIAAAISDGDREAASRRGRRRRGLPGAPPVDRPATSTGPPTTSSATPPSGSSTTTSTSWPAAPASTPASARRGRATARSTGRSPT